MDICKIGVTEFRRHLKDHLTKTEQTYGMVSQVGSDQNLLFMSPQTLERLQRRYFVNIWLRSRYRMLKLDLYPTLSEGAQTGALPLDLLLGLTELFSLAGEVLDVLARPGAKMNAMKWDVTEYVRQADSRLALAKRGRFDGVSRVITRLFLPHVFDINDADPSKTRTLYHFFSCIALFAGLDRDARKEQTEAKTMPLDGLTPEQQELVHDAMFAISGIMTCLMEFQLPNEGELRDGGFVQMDQILDQSIFEPIASWYKNYVGDLPAISILANPMDGI